MVRPYGTAGDFANGVKGLLATDNNQFLYGLSPTYQSPVGTIRDAVGTGTFGGGNLPYMR